LLYQQLECRPHPYASRWYNWPVLWHPVLFYYDATSNLSPSGAPEISSIGDSGNPALWWMSIFAILCCAFWMTRGTPAAWRFGLIALGLASLWLTIVTFHAAEKPDAQTVRVAAGPLFYAGLAGMMAFGGGAVVSATVTRRFVPAFILLGYVTAWLMWAPGNEDRVLFLYHMLGAVSFMALGLAYGLSALRRVRLPVAGRLVSMAPVSTGLVLVVVAAFIFFYPLWTGAPLFPADRALRIWLPGW